MLGSVILFGNTLTRKQSLATVVVFTGLLLDAVQSKRKVSTRKELVEENVAKDKLL